MCRLHQLIFISNYIQNKCNETKILNCKSCQGASWPFKVKRSHICRHRPSNKNKDCTTWSSCAVTFSRVNTILSYTGKNIKFQMHLRFKPLQLTSVSALFPNNIRYVWMIQGITGGRRFKPTWIPWFIATSFIILQFPTTPPQLSVHWRWHHSLTHHRNRNQSRTGLGYCSLWSRAWTLGSRQNTIKRFVITPC